MSRSVRSLRAFTMSEDGEHVIVGGDGGWLAIVSARTCEVENLVDLQGALAASAVSNLHVRIAAMFSDGRASEPLLYRSRPVIETFARWRCPSTNTCCLWGCRADALPLCSRAMSGACSLLSV